MILHGRKKRPFTAFLDPVVDVMLRDADYDKRFMELLSRSGGVIRRSASKFRSSHCFRGRVMKMEPRLVDGRQRLLEDNDSSDSVKSCVTVGSPINLKQIRASQSTISDKEASDITESKCAKTKAFTIKDILGLDDKDKRDDIERAESSESMFNFSMKTKLQFNFEF